MALLVVVAAVGYWWMQRPPGPYKRDNSGLYQIFSDSESKWGFMDRSGKTVIAPQFDNASAFSEGLAPVAVGTRWGYINTRGVMVITPQFDQPSAFRYGRAIVKLCCAGNYANYIGTTAPVTTNRYGIIDEKGKYVGSPTLTAAGSVFSGDYAPARTADGHIGVINRSGSFTVIDSAEVLGDRFGGGLVSAQHGGKWGYLNPSGKWVIAPQFDIAYTFEEGVAPVSVGGRYGLITRSGEFVANPQYVNLSEISEGRAVFATGPGSVVGCPGCWRFGFLNKKGEVAVEPRFVARWDPRFAGGFVWPVGSFTEGLAAADTGDGYGFIDQTGKFAIGPAFDRVSGFENGLAFVVIGGKHGYITKTGAFVVNPFPGMTPQDARVQAFLGKWSYANGLDSIEVSKKTEGIVVVWKSASQGFAPHEIICHLMAGALIGDYYGGTRNFQLVQSGKSLSLNINPFAEFQPIRNQAFSKAEPLDPERQRAVRDSAQRAAAEKEAQVKASQQAAFERLQRGFLGDWVSNGYQITLTRGGNTLKAVQLHGNIRALMKAEILADGTLKLTTTGIQLVDPQQAPGESWTPTYFMRLGADGRTLTGRYENGGIVRPFAPYRRQ